MDARQIAKAALEIYNDKARRFGYTKREIAALSGFFSGVANGSITVGQSWPVKLLLFERALQESQRLTANNLNEEEVSVLENVFASGMCCDGQTLDRGRGGHSRQKS